MPRTGHGLHCLLAPCRQRALSQVASSPECKSRKSPGDVGSLTSRKPAVDVASSRTAWQRAACSLELIAEDAQGPSGREAVPLDGLSRSGRRQKEAAIQPRPSGVGFRGGGWRGTGEAAAARSSDLQRGLCDAPESGAPPSTGSHALPYRCRTALRAAQRTETRAARIAGAIRWRYELEYPPADASKPRDSLAGQPPRASDSELSGQRGDEGERASSHQTGRSRSALPSPTTQRIQIDVTPGHDDIRYEPAETSSVGGPPCPPKTKRGED